MMNRPIHLLDLIDNTKLEDFLDSFTEVTGVAAIIADSSGQPITKAHNFSVLCEHFCRSSESGRQKCWESDSFGGRQSAKLKKRFIYQCLNAKLIDSAYPIIVDGYHLGTALCGQVLFEPIEQQSASRRAAQIGVKDVDGYFSALKEIPIMAPNRFESIVSHMQVVTQTISELALQKYLSNLRSRQYLNKLINSVSDGIISTNDDAIISIVNDGCARMFNCEKKKLIGHSFYSLFLDAASVKTCQKQMGFHDQQNGRVVLTAVDAKNKPFPVQMSISRFRSDERKNSGYVAVLRDISEEKKTEQMKEDLIGMLTHDMGNPVLSIQKAIQMMVDGTLGRLNRNQMEIMNLALGTSHQLLGMVTDFLDIYRNENGMFLLRKMPTDLVQIVEEGINHLRIFALDKQVSITTRLPADPIFLGGDRNRLVRAFSNLIDNAIRFSPSGGNISVVLSSHHKATMDPDGQVSNQAIFRKVGPDHDYVLTTITDQGPGIPKEYQKRIFEKFFAIKPKKNNSRKGLGLGLAFCKLVIEAHVGSIWVTSPAEDPTGTPSPGSRFSILLPIDRKRRHKPMRSRSGRDIHG